MATRRSEGFALTGYVVPGCVEDGTWILWENSSVVVAVAVVAHLGRGGDAETFAFPEIKCSPQAAFDFLDCDFGVSGMH